MALVAYGSSDESDVSDAEEEVVVKSVTVAENGEDTKTDIPTKLGEKGFDSKLGSGTISDDEDEEWIGQASAGVEDLDIPGLSTSKSIFDSLPQARAKRYVS